MEQRLSALSIVGRSVDHYDELEALISLHELMPRCYPDSDDLKVAAFRLFDIAHGYTFMDFFRLKKQRSARKENSAEQ